MTLASKIEFVVTMDAQELNIIGKALRGVLKEDELTEARELSKTLARLKAGDIKSRLSDIEKLEANLQKATA